MIFSGLGVWTFAFLETGKANVFFPHIIPWLR